MFMRVHVIEKGIFQEYVVWRKEVYEITCY